MSLIQPYYEIIVRTLCEMVYNKDQYLCLPDEKVLFHILFPLK